MIDVVTCGKCAQAIKTQQVYAKRDYKEDRGPFRHPVRSGGPFEVRNPLSWQGNPFRILCLFVRESMGLEKGLLTLNGPQELFR